MALNSSSPGSTTSLSSIAFRSNNPRNSPTCKHFFPNLSSPVTESLRVSADSTPKAKFLEYMSLPASQYSVLDAERIERVDDNTFRVEEQPDGCCIKLLSCKLEGSPIVVSQNEKFDAYMVNQIFCDSNQSNSAVQQLTSDAVIEVSISIPFAFRAIPAKAIESTGGQILEQILGQILPRFMAQLVKDYQAWATGDASRQPLGTGITCLCWIIGDENPGCPR
ncbi:hypothetical protein OIU78_006197 [Salix suchowensis]|nr:hypothetical protein OIU78_006197 [Salix suchowensis]